MALIEHTFFGKINKVDKAIEELKNFEPPEGYIIGHSGGKDSVVIAALAKMAGVKHECIHNFTSVDPPELVAFVDSLERKGELIIQKPRYANGKLITMWNLIPLKKIPPTRLCRYCCHVLKESQNHGRLTITGVRHAESYARKTNQGLITIFNGKKAMKAAPDADFIQTKRGGVILNFDNAESRRAVEMCYRTNNTLINPIREWLDCDVWEFIHAEKIQYCGLYDCGKNRLGCIGCPNASTAEREADFKRYPNYKKAYISTFKKMLSKLDNAYSWTCGEDVFDWWIQSVNIEKPLPGQMYIDDFAAEISV